MKKSAVITCLMVAMVLTLLVFAGAVAAQDKPADNMRIVLEKIKADKKFLVAENMDLTAKEAKAFWPVYDQYQDELFLLRMRMIKLIKDYRDSYEKMTDATAKKLLDEALAIEDLGVKVRKAYLPKFRKVLPDVKVARYFQIENKIHAVMLYELAGSIPLVSTDKK